MFCYNLYGPEGNSDNYFFFIKSLTIRIRAHREQYLYIYIYIAHVIIIERTEHIESSLQFIYI